MKEIGLSEATVARIAATPAASPRASGGRNVTVVDTTPPVVTSSLLLTMLGPPFDHSLINVGLAASATDGCEGSRPVSVKVFGDENDETVTGNDGNFSPDARDIAPVTLRLRRERIGTSDGRVYLVVTKAADTSGNTGFSCQTVVVPLDTKASTLSAVNAQAATARAYCEAKGGAAPAGYFVIGDGPIIGKKK